MNDHLKRIQPELVRSVLPFGFPPYIDAQDNTVLFRAISQRPIRIEGLGLWGVREGDMVTRTIFGLDQKSASFGEVPAEFYKMREGWSYSDLCAAIERGEEPPKSWGPEGVLGVGVILEVRVRRPSGATLLAGALKLAAWGWELP